MALCLTSGADKAGWRLSLGTLTLHVPVPWLGGAPQETLFPGEVEVEAMSDDCVLVTSTPYRVVALKATVGNDLTETTRRLYATLLRQMAGTSLLRIWNFVPRINDWSAGEEQYRCFCTGRAQAFAHHSEWAQGSYPAASAVGCEGDVLLLYALGTCAGQAIHYENPLQIPAYCYPQAYGTDAPAFSRATVDTGGEGIACFISGTAAVRGYETVFPYELEGQLLVTEENLRVILAEVQGRLPAGALARPPILRAYVRRPEDVPRVESWVRAQGWAASGHYVLLKADICREDLLVEVELSWLRMPVLPSSPRRMATPLLESTPR